MEGELQEMVGRNLRRFRRDLGLSQEAFGEQVGWHRTFVGAVERGERNLPLRTVERIAEQIGVDPRLLLDGALRVDERPPATLVAADGGGGVVAGLRRARPSPA